MTEHAITAVVDELYKKMNPLDRTLFNYERYLLMDKGAYLDAFIQQVPFPPFEVEIQVSSRCNLKCRWCVGDEIQAKKQVLNLPNTINKSNIDTVVDGIIGFRINGLGIEKVKFSGFIGEPLVQKEATLRAIQRLAGAGLQVGLFTNGVYMTEDTWRTLSNIDYVHVSLDAGPSSFYWLKEDSLGKSYTEETFKNILHNIQGLHRIRQLRGNKACVKLNIGYVIVPGNHEDIYLTTKLVMNAGADMIRFKCDIVGKHNIVLTGIIDKAFQQIEQAQRDFNNPPNFIVYSNYSRKDIEQKVYSEWKPTAGCHYQHFLATVGSDGNLYLCDHNTMPGGIPLGNVIDNSFGQVWCSKRRKYLADGSIYICQSSVCPPFGNRANLFLQRITELCSQYGREIVTKAVLIIRSKLAKAV
jgi:MoaA/NifB/PqqE/SkfB family radical SAM enzyme